MSSPFSEIRASRSSAVAPVIAAPSTVVGLRFASREIAGTHENEGFAVARLARTPRVIKALFVIPWQTLDRADVPGGGELTLVRRGEEFAIRLNGAELMASRAHASEERMAVIAAEIVGTKVARPTVFIGGLGLGYTLRATLDAFPPATNVVVAELVPQVVAWMHGPLAHLAGHVLKNPRVKVEMDDAVLVMQRSVGRFDALLVDIDNSPTTLVRAKNAQLYSERGLRIAKAALAPNGVLVVWSAGPDARFAGRMKSVGFRTREVRVSEHGRGGRAYTLYIGETALAKKRGEPREREGRKEKAPPKERASPRRPRRLGGTLRPV